LVAGSIPAEGTFYLAGTRPISNFGGDAIHLLRLANGVSNRVLLTADFEASQIRSVLAFAGHFDQSMCQSFWVGLLEQLASHIRQLLQ
tara:strand:- start:130 stop:393 length:264 start_codon:yes stop_codon:yes gene_type:complete